MESSPQYLRVLASVRASTNFRRGRFGDIDLHRVAFHFSKRDAELDAALWSRAREVLFAGKKVLVPSGEDSILISLASGVGGNSGDWAIDVGHRISVSSLDWDRIVEMAARRGLVPTALSGLTYLRSLGMAVPERAIARLSAFDVPMPEWLKYWSNVRGHGRRRGLAKKVVNGIADLGLPRRSYDYRVRGIEPVPVRRPSIWPNRGWEPIAVAETTSELKTSHSLHVGKAGAACMIALCVPASESRRVFFDVRTADRALARLRARAGRSAGSASRCCASASPSRRRIAAPSTLRSNHDPSSTRTLIGLPTLVTRSQLCRFGLLEPGCGDFGGFLPPMSAASAASAKLADLHFRVWHSLFGTKAEALRGCGRPSFKV